MHLVGSGQMSSCSLVPATSGILDVSGWSQGVAWEGTPARQIPVVGCPLVSVSVSLQETNFLKVYTRIPFFHPVYKANQPQANAPQN